MKNKEYIKHKSMLLRARVNKQNYIAVLPSLITLINGICGFTALGFASMGKIDGDHLFSFGKINIPYLELAGYMIFFGMIADMLDGRVARMSNSTSRFGGQLDSLCDMITFGIAPAFLVLRTLSVKLLELVDPPKIMGGFLIRFIWISVIVYVCCAAIRLARFNVANETEDTDHMNFYGLPSPAAAGVLASLIIFYHTFIQMIGDQGSAVKFSEAIIMFSLPFITLGTGILMISNVKYPHIANKYLKGRKPLTSFVMVVLVLIFAWLYLETALLICFMGFAFTALVKHLYVKLKKAPSKNTNNQ